MRAERAALLKQIVVGEAQARGIPLSGRAEAQLEEAVLACYIARGCTHDPTTWRADAPTISDVVAMLRERQADDALIAHMALFTGGRLGRLIDAPGDLIWQPSRLRPDVAVLGIDLSAFVTGNDQTLRRVLPVLIGNACVTLALANAGRVPMELILDEAWTLLQSGAGASVLEVVGRIGRALKVGATVITQQVREFLERPAGEGVVVNTAGQAFLANCETVLLLRQLRPPRGQSAPEDNPIVMAARHFGLTPGEAHWLAQCRRTERGSTY